MNYDTLFPKLLKNLPEVCWNTKYNSTNAKGRNSKINIFIPKSKKYLLWFTECDGENYSVLLSINNNKVTYTNFIYLGFDPSLAYNGGTLLYCAKIRDQLCCYKTMYYKGNNYNEGKNYLKHLDTIHYILRYEINHQKNENKICLPYMSHHRDPILLSSTFSFPIYEIFDLNNKYIKFEDFCGYFNIRAVNPKRDIYELHCKNQDNSFIYYCMAYCSNHHISHVLKTYFDTSFKSYHYTQEYDSETEEIISKRNDKNIIVKCVYIPVLKKWKPVEIVDKGQGKYFVSNIKKIHYIERNNQTNKKTNYNRKF